MLMRVDLKRRADRRRIFPRDDPPVDVDPAFVRHCIERLPTGNHHDGQCRRADVGRRLELADALVLSGQRGKQLPGGDDGVLALMRR